MGGSQSFGKVLALVFGVILVALGLAVIIGELLVIPAYTITSISAVVGGSASFPIQGNSSAFILIAFRPVNISIMTINAYFRVAVAPMSLLPPVNATYPSLILTHWVNVSELHNVSFTGNYTSISIELKPGQALIIWPYRVFQPYAFLSYDFKQLPEKQHVAFNPLNLLFLIPVLIVGIALMIGGVFLIMWSRK